MVEQRQQTGPPTVDSGEETQADQERYWESTG